MTDDPCECCGPVGDPAVSGEGLPTSRTTTDVDLDDPLPADLRSAARGLPGDEEVTTLSDWVRAVRAATSGGPITVEDLCHVDGETGHWGVLDGKRYDFACFYDAVLLAALAERPVAVRSETPEGTVIVIHATPEGELHATPDTMVMSFGIAADVSPPGGDGPSHADVYGAVSPYVKAFPSREAYERWAADVPAATVPLTVEQARTLATELLAD